MRFHWKSWGILPWLSNPDLKILRDIATMQGTYGFLRFTPPNWVLVSAV